MAAACAVPLVAQNRSVPRPGRLLRPDDKTPGEGMRLSFSNKPVALPDFPLFDLDGKRIDRAQWAKKVVVLNFWATWCEPCRVEIPELVALQRRYSGLLVVVGMSVDEVAADAVQAFATERHVNYPVSIIPASVERVFGGVTIVPTTVVVNKAGQMVQRHRGLANPDRLEQEVRWLAGLQTAAAVEFLPDVELLAPSPGR